MFSFVIGKITVVAVTVDVEGGRILMDWIDPAVVKCSGGNNCNCTGGDAIHRIACDLSPNSYGGFVGVAVIVVAAGNLAGACGVCCGNCCGIVVCCCRGCCNGCCANAAGGKPCFSCHFRLLYAATGQTAY